MTTAEQDGVELQTLLPHHADGLNSAAIWVLDGQEVLQFTEIGAHAEYLDEYPEADNDGVTRLFHYTSKSSMGLLVKLFVRQIRGVAPQDDVSKPRAQTTTVWLPHGELCLSSLFIWATVCVDDRGLSFRFLFGSSTVQWRIRIIGWK
jgi:hypothetical protein